MAETKIKSVKIVKGKNDARTVTVSYVKTHNDGSHRTVEESSDAEIHRDLKRAMSGMNIHLAVLSEFVTTREVRDIKKYDKSLTEAFHVTSYSIGGKDEQQGIVITGHKILSNGKALGLNTPFTRFEEDDKSKYKFMDHLLTQISKIEDEVTQYLDGKIAEDPQGSLFAEEEKPGKNGRGKK